MNPAGSLDNYIFLDVELQVLIAICYAAFCAIRDKVW